jgi:hypothetical protein
MQFYLKEGKPASNEMLYCDTSGEDNVSDIHSYKVPTVYALEKRTKWLQQN